MLKKDPFNLIITGVGGQGNVIASLLLGQMLLRKGYVVTIGETYGASQRGGSVVSHVRISATENFSPLIPEGMCHLVVGLEPSEGLRVLGRYGNPEVIVLLNTRPIHPIDVISGATHYPSLDKIVEEIKGLSSSLRLINATEIAMELGDPILSNMVMLGALSALNLLPLDEKVFREVIEEAFSSDRLEVNLRAFRMGMEKL